MCSRYGRWDFYALVLMEQDRYPTVAEEEAVEVENWR
jgi:hypothetical protein